MRIGALALASAATSNLRTHWDLESTIPSCKPQAEPSSWEAKTSPKSWLTMPLGPAPTTSQIPRPKWELSSTLRELTKTSTKLSHPLTLSPLSPTIRRDISIGPTVTASPLAKKWPALTTGSSCQAPGLTRLVRSWRREAAATWVENYKRRLKRTQWTTSTSILPRLQRWEERGLNSASPREGAATIKTAPVRHTPRNFIKRWGWKAAVAVTPWELPNVFPS